MALLLAGVAAPGHATAATAQAPPPEEQSREAIIITAPLFRDITPERQLDQDAIESYGVSTIDELLGEVQVELGDDAEQPLILVNGKRLNDLSEVGALPVEALRNMQVLPRGSAVKVGGTTGQRVISLTLNRKVMSETLSAAPKVATDGDWSAVRGEAIVTKIRGDMRANLTLRSRGETNLLESERGIIQPAVSRPYALGGNIVGYPNTTGEIDPLLSALAGEVVTVAPNPNTASPTLADFVARANEPASTNLGQFRTLRPRSRNYELNGTFATPLTSWLTGSATVRLSRNTSRGERGLPGVLFVLPATNAFTPFSRDVGVAYYGTDPLRYRSRRDGGEANLTLDANWGPWIGNFNARHSQSKDTSYNERQSNLGAITLDDNVNPFTTDLTPLIGITDNRTSSHYYTTLAEATVTGPLLRLPAGPLQTTFNGELTWYHLRGRSNFSNLGDRNVRRNQQMMRAAVDIPLTSVSNDFGAAVGNLSATAEYSRAHYSDAGNMDNHALGLTWEPRPLLRLHGEYQDNQQPPGIETLGSPVVVTPGVRMFDPLTGTTVDVTQITGGNPDLLPQKTKIRRANALLRLVPKWKLQLNAEYTDTDRRKFVSSLPEASAAVMLAFPDRFIRDSNGVLTTADLRPVNFDSDREKKLRWGFSLNRKLGGSGPTGIAPGSRVAAAGGLRKRPTFFQLTANHTMVFSEKIVIRPGLDPVDLLHGGAIGIASGRTRHQVDGTASINSGGLGARVGVTWRGKSTLESRISGVEDTLRFSPVMVVNVRAFADMKRFLPHSDFARGFRLSLDVINLFNDRQKVRDSFGNTPLQYQPGYRDPIGRTIEIELRKVF